MHTTQALCKLGFAPVQSLVAKLKSITVSLAFLLNNRIVQHFDKGGGLLFADGFVRVSESGEQLKRVIDVVHSYCSKWRLKANVSESAV